MKTKSHGFSFLILAMFFLSRTVFALEVTPALTNNTDVLPIYTASQKVIVVDKDQPSFIIKLVSNPSTGYSWFLHEYQSELILPMRHELNPPGNGLMGAPQYEMWTMEVTPEALAVPHEISIRFNYSRPWQGGDSSTSVAFKVFTK